MRDPADVSRTTRVTAENAPHEPAERSLPAAPELSVVVPAHDEEGNILLLARGLREALVDFRYEIVIVDDASKDGTRAEALAARAEDPRVRVIVREKRGGKSGALFTGFEAAQGLVVATIDADLQNDPADVARCVRALGPGVDGVNGKRNRKEDGGFRYLQSRIGNGFRRWLAGGTVTDAGTGIKCFRRECLPALLLPFEGMHRYFGELMEMSGYKVVEVPISQRPRHAGVAKYGLRNRALRGVFDVLAVRWMRKRLVARPWHEVTK
jgi:dolichol-phosphate mannosyltransferase